MNKSKMRKRNRKLRKPVAIIAALALTAAILPTQSKVSYAASGWVIEEYAKDNNINKEVTEDIVAANSGVYLEASQGHQLIYKLKNITASTVDSTSFGTIDYALQLGASGEGTKMAVETNNISASIGRALYVSNNHSELDLTTGDIKTNKGMDVTSTSKGIMNLKTGNVESAEANYLKNSVYFMVDGGTLNAEFGDMKTTKSGEPLNISTSHGGTMNIKAGKLTSIDAAAIAIGGSSNAKLVLTTGEVNATGGWRSNVIYSSGGTADIDVTINGNATSEGTALALGDAGSYKILGDLTSKEGEGIGAGSTYGDTDVLVTGTITAAGHGVNGGSSPTAEKKLTLTIWKIVWGEKSQAFCQDDENETFAKSVNYIVKTVHPLGVTNDFRVVKADGTSALDTKTYKHGDKDETFEVAHQGDRLYLKSDKKILKAYNGSGANKVELPKDAAGNYYYDVVKGGGIELSADIEGVTPVTPTAAPTAAPTTAPTAAPTVAPTTAPTAAPTAAPTQAPVVKKANPIKVTPRRIYGAKKHDVTVKKSRAFTIEKAKGKLTFEKVSASSHKITIDKKTGDVTIKKRLKPDKNYFLTVKITAAGDAEYKPKTVKVQLRIRIKD